MLEAGSIRSKNVTNILIKNFGDLCIGVTAFFIIGYGLAFSEGNPYFGQTYFGLFGLPFSLYPHAFMQVRQRGGSSPC
jgi:Amt family ammonium transporter